MFATNPENEAIVLKLVNALVDLPVGAIAPYDQLKRIGGRDLLNGRRYLLKRARDKAEIQARGIFEAVKSVGVKRLTAAEAPEIGLAGLRGIRRKAKRCSRRLDHIDSNSLSDHERRRTIAYRSHHNAIAMMSDGNKSRTIAAVIDPAKPIPPEDILRMFLK